MYNSLLLSNTHFRRFLGWLTSNLVDINKLDLNRELTLTAVPPFFSLPSLELWSSLSLLFEPPPPPFLGGILKLSNHLETKRPSLVYLRVTSTSLLLVFK